MAANLLARGKSISSHLSKTKFRCIREGQGGTLNFRDPPRLIESTNDKTNDESITYVGTYGVRTCVGVYFAIDDDRCFIAHINAYGQFAWNGVPNRFVDSPWEADFFRHRVFSKLKKHAAENDWSPEVARSRILQSLIMVCPLPEDQFVPSKMASCLGRWINGKPPATRIVKKTGHHIIEGIQDFLQIKQPAEKHGGFVVGHMDGHRTISAWDSEGWQNGRTVYPADLVKFEPVEECFPADKKCEWEIGLPQYAIVGPPFMS